MTGRWLLASPEGDVEWEAATLDDAGGLLAATAARHRETALSTIRPPSYDVRTGEALTVLRGLPARKFQCCVTSPPYFQLRDYGHADQLGQEETPDLYISRLADIFEEVRRTLRDDGTLWVVLADTYCSNPSTSTTPRALQGNGTGSFRVPAQHHADARRGRANRATPLVRAGYPLKSLLGIPGMLIAEMQRRGWVYRSPIVWAKRGGMPENVRDRRRSAYEFVLLFAKRKRYFYDQLAVPEARDNLWTLPVNSYRADHAAMMPLSLADRCIRLASAPGDEVVDPFGGLGTVPAAALAAGRSTTAIELNPDYAVRLRKRLSLTVS